MASVQKREGRPNPWEVRYRTPDGKSRRRQFARKGDAEKFAATTEADKVRGAWVDPALGRVTLDAWAEHWQKGLHDLRASTRDLNLRTLRVHVLPRFGRYRLADLRTTDVKGWVADELTAGTYSGSAVRRHVLVLRQVLAGAVADGLIARNPCEGVTLPPESTRPMRVLDAAQVAALADAIRPGHFRPLVLTAAYVGLRFGELAGLGVEHVDPLRRTIRVERQLVELAGQELAYGPPKTRNGVRTVTMPATIAELLGEHMGTEPVQTSGLVFPNSEGRPMRRGSFARVWRRAVDGRQTKRGREPGVFTGTDLEGLVFHELRHTAASLAIAHGAHPLVVRDRLGHSSITTTMDRYGHLFPSMDEAVAEQLDQTLRRSLAERGVSQVCPDRVPAARLRRSVG